MPFVRLPSPRTLTAVATSALLAAACYQPPTSIVGQDSNTVPTGNTSTPLTEADPNASVPSGNQPSGGNDVVDANQALNGNQAATPNGTTTAGGFTLSPPASQDFCLTTQSDPPAEGDGVSLRSCTAGANQRWTWQAKRLRIGHDLCLTHPGARQLMASAAAAGDPNLVPVVTACDSNAVNLKQQVTFAGGSVVLNDGPSTWALSYQTPMPTTADPLVWLQSNRGAAQSWMAALHSHDGNSQLVRNRFALAAAPAFALCLDANAGTGDAAAAGLQICDPNVASQRWTYQANGLLQNDGRCLDVNASGQAQMATCDANQASRRWGTFLGVGQLSNDNSRCMAGYTDQAGPLTTDNCSASTAPAMVFGWGMTP